MPYFAVISEQNLKFLMQIFTKRKIEFFFFFGKLFGFFAIAMQIRNVKKKIVENN